MKILSNLGCEEMQGYLFSRPVAASDIMSILAELDQGTTAMTQTSPMLHVNRYDWDGVL